MASRYRVSLFFPSGRDFSGWLSIKSSLDSFLNSSSLLPSRRLQVNSIQPPPLSSSFVDALKSSSGGSSGGPFSLARELSVEQGLFGSSECVLIVKDFAFDSWDSISRGIRMSFEEVLLKPFCDNLAGILVKNGALRKRLLDFGRGSLLGCSLCILPWDSAFVAESWSLAFSGGWVVLEDFPPHLRSSKVVESLAALCGGLVGSEDQIVLGDSWEDEVRFKARGNENGFIPRGCFLSQDGVDFRVRFASWKLEDRRPKVRSEKMKKLLVSGDVAVAGPSPQISLLISGKNSVREAQKGQKNHTSFKLISREIQSFIGSSCCLGLVNKIEGSGCGLSIDGEASGSGPFGQSASGLPISLESSTIVGGPPVGRVSFGPAVDRPSSPRVGSGKSRLGLGIRFSRIRSGSSPRVGSDFVSSSLHSSPVGSDCLVPPSLERQCDSDLELVSAGSDPSIVSFSEDDSFLSSPIRGDVEADGEFLCGIFEGENERLGCREAVADASSSLASLEVVPAVDSRPEEVLSLGSDRGVSLSSPAVQVCPLSSTFSSSGLELSAEVSSVRGLFVADPLFPLSCSHPVNCVGPSSNLSFGGSQSSLIPILPCLSCCFPETQAIWSTSVTCSLLENGLEDPGNLAPQRLGFSGVSPVVSQGGDLGD